MTIIYQPSDLNQRGRAILDAAREGQARIRDKDGVGLLVVPEERVEALEATARYVNDLLVIEDFLKPQRVVSREFIRVSPWKWLAALDDDDIESFVVDLRDSLRTALQTGSLKATERILKEWRVTAEQLGDPDRRQVLLGHLSPDEFVEVNSPEAELSSREPADEQDDNGSEG
jgi:hypothetical protein